MKIRPYLKYMAKILILLIAVLPLNKLFAVESVPRAKYLGYARASADYVWNNYDDIIKKWQDNFDPENVFGYRPPGGLLEMAVIYSELFKLEKTTEYRDRAKKVLLTYGEYRSLYPEKVIKKRCDYEDGVPALPDFFTTMRYIRAYDNLNRLNSFTSQQQKKIETIIVESMNYLLRTQEWGTMNRAALRAETLAWSVRTMPDYPDAGIWEMQRKALGDDNMNYEWDRVITYVKDPEIFVVFDIFKSRTEDFFTLANLWHTRKIIASGQSWYDTIYDKIGNRKPETVYG